MTEVTTGATVRIHYTGSLEDGTVPKVAIRWNSQSGPA